MRRSSILILFSGLVILFAWFWPGKFKRSSEFADVYGKKIEVRGAVASDPELKNGRVSFVLRPEHARKIF